MSDNAPDFRLDCAVIMARGQSSRLGYPKGMATLGPGQPPFLVLVDSLYRELGFSRLIVTLPSLKDAYQALLGPEPVATWLVEPEGGDTALTLLAAWRYLGRHLQPPTHVWAHPVDLPLVKPLTVAMIKQESDRHPEQVVRPVHDCQPGHPVVIPGFILDSLESDTSGEDLCGPMRQLLARLGSAAVLDFPVKDQGVVRDFDDPGDLKNP